MKNITARGGFTLIEMLIVVAIIGILAGSVLVGLGPVQKGGRDARRVSDLKNVQNGLELYYNKNQKYPDAQAWAALQATLKGAGIGVSNVPQDPKNGATYYYSTDSNGSTYVIGAILEDAGGNAVNSSYQGPPGSNASPSFPGGTCGQAVQVPYAGFLYCTSL